jgi:hypothetical protein
VLYHLSHAPALFAFSYFSNRVSYLHSLSGCDDRREPPCPAFLVVMGSQELFACAGLPQRSS